jgi:hypothetical protein
LDNLNQAGKGEQRVGVPVVPKAFGQVIGSPLVENHLWMSFLISLTKGEMNCSRNKRDEQIVRLHDDILMGFILQT